MAWALVQIRKTIQFGARQLYSHKALMVTMAKSHQNSIKTARAGDKSHILSKTFCHSFRNHFFMGEKSALPTTSPLPEIHGLSSMLEPTGAASGPGHATVSCQPEARHLFPIARVAAQSMEIEICFKYILDSARYL